MTLTAAQRARNYRARQAGQPVPKLPPGPAPSSERDLRDRVRRAERREARLRENWQYMAGFADSTLPERYHRLQKELAEAKRRITALEYLLRAGFRYPPNPAGTFDPLTDEQLEELRRAEESDDPELAREMLLDKWQAWLPER